MGTARFGNVRFRWIKLPSAMAKNVDVLGERMDAQLLAGMTSVSERIESYMKQNAPWQDRTTNARNGLTSNANVTAAHSVTVSAFHTVPYGGFLETGTSRMQPYPILAPALQAHYAAVRKVMDDVASFGGGGASF